MKGAIEDCTKAIALDSDNLLAYVGRANARRVLGDNKGAALDFESALRLDPESKHAEALRAFIREHLGREPNTGK